MIENMKHWIACLSWVVLFVTGCDTVTHSQLQVLAPKTERGRPAVLAVPAAERDAVKQVLSDIATKHHFEDRTGLSLVADTICSYAQADVKHPISLKAWVSKERILIDLFHTTRGSHSTSSLSGATMRSRTGASRQCITVTRPPW